MEKEKMMKELEMFDKILKIKTTSMELANKLGQRLIDKAMDASEDAGELGSILMETASQIGAALCEVVVERMTHGTNEEREYVRNHFNNLLNEHFNMIDESRGAGNSQV